MLRSVLERHCGRSERAEKVERSDCAIRRMGVRLGRIGCDVGCGKRMSCYERSGRMFVTLLLIRVKTQETNVTVCSLGELSPLGLVSASPATTIP